MNFEKLCIPEYFLIVEGSHIEIMPAEVNAVKEHYCKYMLVHTVNHVYLHFFLNFLSFCLCSTLLFPD